MRNWAILLVLLVLITGAQLLAETAVLRHGAICQKLDRSIYSVDEDSLEVDVLRQLEDGSFLVWAPPPIGIHLIVWQYGGPVAVSGDSTVTVGAKDDAPNLKRRPNAIPAYTIVKIEGCEYILCGGSLTHKGNCARCKQRMYNEMKRACESAIRGVGVRRNNYNN